MFILFIHNIVKVVFVPKSITFLSPSELHLLRAAIAAAACQTSTEVAHFQKVVCGFYKNVTGDRI